MRKIFGLSKLDIAMRGTLINNIFYPFLLHILVRLIWLRPVLLMGVCVLHGINVRSVGPNDK